MIVDSILPVDQVVDLGDENPAMGKLCRFASLRCILTILNVFYIAVGLFLIGLSVAGRTLSYFFEVHILIGTALCGTVLVLIAVLGLVGTAKHHQVILFFYMVLLGLCGIVLFSVSIAALAFPDSLGSNVFSITWKNFDVNRRSTLQDMLNCCGFNSTKRNASFLCDHMYGHPPCNTTALTKSKGCCHDSIEDDSHDMGVVFLGSYGNSTVENDTCVEDPSYCPKCQPCYEYWKGSVTRAVETAGALGLIFSLTQIAGILLSLRYRNLRNPEDNPSAFL